MPFHDPVHVLKFASMSKIQHTMVGVDTPRSLDDWVMGLKQVSNSQCKKSIRSYGFLWLYRSYLYAETRAAGIKRLAVSGKNTVGDLQRGFPDQCKWMSRFACATTLKCTKVSALLKQLNYKDPIEHLTMDLCILGSIRKWSPGDISSAQEQFKKELREMDEPGRPAHTAVVLDLVMLELRAGAD